MARSTSEPIIRRTDMLEKNMEDYRAQTEWERGLFDRLLEASFSGRDQLKAQLREAVVRKIDEKGGLAIRVTTGQKAEVLRRVPVEAECADADGTTIHFLLHVIDGTAKELEIYKEDGSPIRKMPSLDALRVV